MALAMTEIIIPKCNHDWVATRWRDLTDHAGAEVYFECQRHGCCESARATVPYGILIRAMRDQDARDKNQAPVSR